MRRTLRRRRVVRCAMWCSSLGLLDGGAVGQGVQDIGTGGGDFDAEQDCPGCGMVMVKVKNEQHSFSRAVRSSTVSAKPVGPASVSWSYTGHARNILDGGLEPAHMGRHFPSRRRERRSVRNPRPESALRRSGCEVADDSR